MFELTIEMLSYMPTLVYLDWIQTVYWTIICVTKRLHLDKRFFFLLKNLAVSGTLTAGQNVKKGGLLPQLGVHFQHKLMFIFPLLFVEIIRV